jgi:drug/metabolite transporter (DMT)-like permease
VTQARAARRSPGDHHLHIRLVLRLLHDPAWVGGFIVSVAGFGLQALALSLAPVLLVQPLIVTELLFALPLAALLAGVQLRAREYVAAALIAAGLSGFVLVASPAGNRTQASQSTWILVISAVALAVVTLVVLADRVLPLGTMRTSAMAAAAGICFGLLPILTKTVIHQFSRDGSVAGTHAQPWLLCITALVGLTLAQTAFRSGPIAVSLPMIDIGEPLVASLIAVLAFSEHVNRGTSSSIGIGLTGAAVVAGILMLDTSPTVQASQSALMAGTPPGLPSRPS